MVPECSRHRTPTQNENRSGVSQTAVAIQDDRIEVQGIAFDQDAVHNLINKLTTIKSLLPEKSKDDPDFLK
jgi:hypothetical protein